MSEALRDESEKLVRSWMQHDAAHLRDYLVASVEDPRLNLQSVLSRHFLVRALAGERFNMLMEQEYRFAALMNWVAKLIPRLGDDEEFEAVLYGLRKGSDNAEGIPIPHYVAQIFSTLPVEAGPVVIPNYIEAALARRSTENGRASLDEKSLDTFSSAWKEALSSDPALQSSLPSRITHHASPVVSVLEPACGSANDYRFLDRYGIAQWIDYTGIDICAKNVENAHALFPSVRFELENVFEIASRDKAFDFCFVHDLFEHLSMDGIARAVEEISRVTARGICVGFFNMDEIEESVMHPVDDYHWNTLSMVRMAELFARQGFAAQVIHIGTFLRQHIGCDETHNANAYTFWMKRKG